MKYKLVQGEDHLVRDMASTAILSTDAKGLNDYKMSKQKKLDQRNKILQCENDINMLNSELKDIKKALSLILEKVSKE